MEETIGIVMRAGDIPEFSVVAKAKGDKEYTLRDSLKIYYRDGNDPYTVSSSEGARLIVDSRGNANAVGNEEYLKWITTPEEFRDYLEFDPK